MLRSVGEFLHRSESDSLRLSVLVREFSGIVNTKEFPCIYSRVPFVSEEIYFGLLDADNAEESAVTRLRELCSLIRRQPDAVAALFLDSAEQRSLQDDLRLASGIVQAVMRANAEDDPYSTLSQPDDPEWMLSLEGVGLFLNFSSPAYQARRSRHVGSAFTVIAQARESFDRLGRSSDKSRAEIRRRLAEYDSVPPHPALARYGDPEAREALQYFLGDDMNYYDPTGACLRA
ncbi:YqcI/YcgG family protein [Streptomyces heilongjiangensis]|uniref:YqcI/YcgG family protein n=1 Tax=Streptomyces heilongjiangensis TaxID=945052 RepID=A0ABW1BJ78_9ACTN|nr:YqcI/YcgG family protein [Streptomyces heilongjiangensis]MDC2952106.1 YqcI/YcgG family protein [Streptomyces heilongjiangensis]